MWTKYNNSQSNATPNECSCKNFYLFLYKNLLFDFTFSLFNTPYIKLSILHCILLKY